MRRGRPAAASRSRTNTLQGISSFPGWSCLRPVSSLPPAVAGSFTQLRPREKVKLSPTAFFPSFRRWTGSHDWQSSFLWRLPWVPPRWTKIFYQTSSEPSQQPGAGSVVPPSTRRPRSSVRPYAMCVRIRVRRRGGAIGGPGAGGLQCTRPPSCRSNPVDWGTDEGELKLRRLGVRESARGRERIKGARFMVGLSVCCSLISISLGSTKGGGTKQTSKPELISVLFHFAASISSVSGIESCCSTLL